MTTHRQLIRAPAVIDAAGVTAAPGVLLAEGNRIIAAGRPGAVGAVGDAEVVESAGVLIPGLVNAHTHLDLTDLGPRSRNAGESFIDWIRMIRAARGGVSDAEIAQAVRHGTQLSRRGGTALVGDIAGAASIVAVQTLRECQLPGVSYLEVFGMGDRQNAAIAGMKSIVDNLSPFENGVALGIQPHAPYSCGPRVYHAAAALGLPFATHLAETPEEVDFTVSGSGPIVDFLQELKLWDGSVDVSGEHPVDAVLKAVDNLSILAVHVNYLGDRQLERLAQGNAHVVYCPRASAYFGHAGHRYRDLLAAGVNVALGTDSIVCLDTPGRLSVLDEMRLLHQRDGTPVETLLRMATINGARALGFDEAHFTFTPGAVAGVLALELPDDAPRTASAAELLAAALSKPQDPQWIVNSQGIRAAPVRKR